MHSDNHSENSSSKKICLIGCRYDVVCRVALEFQYRVCRETDLWDLNWSDSPLAPEKVMEMRRLQIFIPGTTSRVQKINHFPGMYEICRKDRLGRNLNRLKRIFPFEYDFFPPTWDLPSCLPDLHAFSRRNRKATYIIKPEAGCQGKGIFLVNNINQLSPFVKCVCQQYISHPFLVNGYKYDQRIYVLITCVDPLRIYIYNEGIARFATVKYSPPSDDNLDVVYMHLTNYSLNKESDSYDSGGVGSKQKLSVVYQWMADLGYNVKKLKQDINDVIIKTILCAAPSLQHNYRTSFPKRDRPCCCFELLGFDILVDDNLKPHLVEVNHSPSFNLDLPVDTDVKISMLKTVFAMLYYGEGSNSHKKLTPLEVKQSQLLKSLREQIKQTYNIPEPMWDQFIHEHRTKGNFRLVFAEERPGKYSRFMNKEYWMVKGTEDEGSAMKHRIEPPLNEKFSMDTWASPEPVVTTALKQTSNGQTYVETRPKTPSLFDPNVYMKFKSSNTRHAATRESYRGNLIRGSLYGAIPNVIDKPPKRQTSVKKKAVKNANVIEEKQAIEEDNSEVTISNHKKSHENDDGPVDLPKIQTSKLSITEDALNNINLTPSQRVHLALEKLKVKKFEKFNLTSKLNGSPFGSTSSSIIKEVSSTLLRLEKSKLSEERKMLKHEMRKPLKKVTAEVLNLDTSKLPSVLENPIVAKPYTSQQPRSKSKDVINIQNQKQSFQDWISVSQQSVLTTDSEASKKLH